MQPERYSSRCVRPQLFSMCCWAVTVLLNCAVAVGILRPAPCPTLVFLEKARQDSRSYSPCRTAWRALGRKRSAPNGNVAISIAESWRGQLGRRARARERLDAERRHIGLQHGGARRPLASHRACGPSALASTPRS